MINYESMAREAAKELDAEAEAESLYDEYTASESGQATWGTVGELFPDYNLRSEDTDAAAEYVIKDIEVTLGDRFTEAEWAAVEEKLYEKVYAGLT